MKKASTNQRLLSIILTLGIIFVLVISGPASAVTLDISMDRDKLEEGSEVSFLVDVDIAPGEHVPVQNLTVNVTNSDDGAESYVCIFDFEGLPLTGCTGFVIERISGSGSFASGYGYGYGAGGFANTSFGYGYGLGYLGVGSEAVYNITWETPSGIDASRDYSVEFYATASDGTNMFQYRTLTGDLVSVQDTEVVLDEDDYTVSYNNTRITVTQVVNDTRIVLPPGVTGVSLNLSSMVNASANQTQVRFQAPVTVNSTSPSGRVSMQLPANLTMTSTNGWRGDFSLPQTVTSPVSAGTIADSGKTATITDAILIGEADRGIELDHAARLFFTGGRDKYIGYYSNGTFTKITTSCPADTQAAGDALDPGAACRRNVGNDAVVWTKHFSTYIVYSQADASSSSSSSSSGGGGGGGGALPTCTSDWECSEWSACQPDGTRTRTCVDNNECDGATQPATEEACTYQAPEEEETEEEETEEETEEESGMEETTGEATTEAEEEQEQEVIEESGRGGLIWTLIVLLVIIGIVAGYFMSNNVAFLNKRSERLHKLADENHAKGNVAKAQSQHEKAYKLQQRALDRKLR